MSADNFVRPFGDVLSSFLITLRNQGRIQIENSEIEGLFDQFLSPGWQSWHVVDASAEAKDPTVTTDPETGKRTLEFLEAEAMLDAQARDYAARYGIDECESFEAIRRRPESAQLVQVYSRGPAAYGVFVP